MFNLEGLSEHSIIEGVKRALKAALRTSVATSESDYARAHCGDL